MFQRFREKVVGIVALVMVLASPSILVGCKTLESHSATAELAVTYATIKGIEQGLDASAIRRVAGEVKDLATGQATTVSLLEEAVRGKVAGMGLSPADRYLAGALIKIVAQELTARTGTGLLDPEQVLYVSQVMGWIINASELAKPA